MINCSSRPLQRHPVQTHHIHMHVWRFLLGQEFNWFLYNWTKWRATQTDLPPQYFRAGYCPSPSVCALENFKGIKEWDSTDIRQSSKQSSPNVRSTKTLLLSCKHSWPWHRFCSSLTTFILGTCKSWGTPGNSQPQLFSIALFCGLLCICHLEWAKRLQQHQVSNHIQTLQVLH